MPTETQMKQKTPIVWANSGDYVSTISGLVRTAQINLTGILNAEAREGAQVNLGTNRFHEYLIFMGIEFLAANPPTEGEAVNLYLPGSTSGTPANANPGGLTGADADYAPTNPDLAAGLATLGEKFVMTLDDRAATSVQYAVLGRLLTPLQYIIPVVHSEAATGLFHTDAIQMFVALIPLTPEAQTA